MLAHRLLISTLPFLLSGCFIASAPVAKDAPLSGKEGYIYGRFLHKSYVEGSRTKDIGVNVQDLSQNLGANQPTPYMMAVKPAEEAVYAIAVKPGQYRLSQFVYGDNFRTKDINWKPLNQAFNVEAGKAYYVGDYTATGSVIYGSNVITTRWKFEDVAFRFRSTSNELDRRYPAFQAIAKVFPYGDELTDIEALGEHEAVSPSDGLIYGEFKLSTENIKDPKDIYIALVVENEAGKVSTVKFSLERRIKAFPLPPGKYTVNKIIVGSTTQTIEDSKNHMTFSVQAGEAIYLGSHDYQIERFNVDGENRFRDSYQKSFDKYQVDKDRATAAYDGFAGLKQGNARQ